MSSQVNENRPNVLLILNDDMGFSDLGCYGGEVCTPNIDRLAREGLRFTQFYNTARCCPSRASLLTGLHPHQANVGHMTDHSDEVDGYLGDLSRNAVTLAEALKPAGYSTYMSGKWHVARHVHEPGNWPCQRGFDEYYGIIDGAANYFNPGTLTRNNERIETPPGEYYLTDAISDEAVTQIRTHVERNPGKPFFQYVAYTAPHWPLQARPEDIGRYKGRFDRGWDALRQERLDRLVGMGIIHPDWKLSPRDPSQPEWAKAEHKEWEVRRMEVYAAQIDRMDQGIGRILNALRNAGRLDNTLILFLSDNGGCAEGIGVPPPGAPFRWTSAVTRDGVPVRIGNDPSIMPGGEETFQSYSVAWANVSNTPFRKYKHWVHEGGIATPLIVHWPEGIEERGGVRHQPAQLPDIMATCLDVAGAEYPEKCNGYAIKPLEGFSMVPIFEGGESDREVLYWEHEGNRAVRKGRWKLVCAYSGGWELYDTDQDRTESNDLSGEYPEIVEELASLYDTWAKRCNVKPWDEILAVRKKQREKDARK